MGRVLRFASLFRPSGPALPAVSPMPDHSAERLEYGLVRLEPGRNLRLGHPGVRIKTFGGGFQLFSLRRVGGLLRNARQYLGVTCAQPREPFRSEPG